MGKWGPGDIRRVDGGIHGIVRAGQRQLKCLANEAGPMIAAVDMKRQSEELGGRGAGVSRSSRQHDKAMRSLSAWMDRNQ